MQALSKATETYSFLHDTSAQETTTELNTSWEDNAAKAGLTVGFANTHTGASEFTISPQTLLLLEPLRELKVTAELLKLAKFVQALQRTMPSNGDKLLCFINPSVLAGNIPFCETPNDLTEDLVQQSTVNIDFTDQMAVIDGLPVWERLSGERIEFYQLFKVYRDMRYTVTTDGDYFLLQRTMAGLSRETHLDARLIQTLAKIYNWKMRCTYYDEYMEFQAHKRRMAKIQLMESDHYRVSSQLMNKAVTYLQNNIAKMTPKDALQMFQLGLEYSRLSLGLQTNKPGSTATAPTQPTLAIYNNTTNNNADQMVQVNQNPAFSSEVERQLHEDLKAEDNLLSILHVLQKSGAIDTALREDLKDPTIIDVE